MKKHVLAIFCFIVLPNILVSQKIYFRADAGYATGILKDVATFMSYSYQETSGDPIESAGFGTKAVSYSQGASVEVGAGLEVAPFMAFELTGFYYPGSSVEISSTESYNYINPDYYVNFHLSQTTEGKMAGGKIAALLFYPGKTLRPFFRAGVILGAISMKQIEQLDGFSNNQGLYPSAHSNTDYELKPHMNVGVITGIGLDYFIADRLAIFAEVSGNFVSYVPRYGEVTRFEMNGTDYLDQLNVSERETEYVDAYSSDEYDENQPGKSLKIKVAFSNITASAGLRFNLFD